MNFVMSFVMYINANNAGGKGRISGYETLIIPCQIVGGSLDQ